MLLEMSPMQVVKIFDSEVGGLIKLVLVFGEMFGVAVKSGCSMS